MFALPVAKPKAMQPQRSTVVARRPSQSAVSQARLLQRSIGNQAMIGLLAQGGSVTRNEPGAQEKEADSAHRVAQEAAPSWDFSKIRVFSPGRAERFQMPPLFPAPRPPIQAKLKVGAVNDPLEYEADRVADQVMRMPAPGVSVATAPLQISRKCAACEEEEQTLRSKPAGSARSASEAPGIVNDVLRSPGRPLDAPARAFLEPRFGHDFSRVRVHTDAQAAKSAQAVNALAYTAGRDVVFGANQYAPSAVEGRRLLAHELTHVIQQGNCTESNGLYFSPISTPMLFLQRKSSFPVTGIATCFGDKGDKAGGKGPTSCNQITLPNEKDLFAAWPNLNKTCAQGTKEGGNLPRVGCEGELIVSLGGNSVQVTVQDCGPGEKGRIIDLSLAAVNKLDSRVKKCNDWNNETVTVTTPSEAIKQQIERERAKGAPEYFERGRGIPAP